MFKRKGVGGQRPLEQCSKKLHFSYGMASLILVAFNSVLFWFDIQNMTVMKIKLERWHFLTKILDKN